MFIEMEHLKQENAALKKKVKLLKTEQESLKDQIVQAQLSGASGLPREGGSLLLLSGA